MMKSICASIAALAVLAFAVNAQAHCGHCGSKDTKAASGEKCAAGGCCGEKCASEKCADHKCTDGKCTATKCDEGKGCPIAAAMERLPKMTYTVGDKEVCCPKEAAKLAKEAGTHLHYCVAGKEFDDESAAQTALVEATEKFVADFAKPHKCPKSGQLTLAGKPQSCEKTAAHVAELMEAAMAKVKYTYVVGEKNCDCPIEAAKLAKDTGKEKVICVGEEKTCCEKTARLNLARAKYKAAVEAMVQAEHAAPASETSKGT